MANKKLIETIQQERLIEDARQTKRTMFFMFVVIPIGTIVGLWLALLSLN